MSEATISKQGRLRSGKQTLDDWAVRVFRSPFQLDKWRAELAPGHLVDVHDPMAWVDSPEFGNKTGRQYGQVSDVRTSFHHEAEVLVHFRESGCECWVPMHRVYPPSEAKR